MDYYFRSKVKTKVYERRINETFESEDKMRSVWIECALNLGEIRKSMKEFPG